MSQKNKLNGKKWKRMEIQCRQHNNKLKDIVGKMLNGKQFDHKKEL